MGLFLWIKRYKWIIIIIISIIVIYLAPLVLGLIVGIIGIIIYIKFKPKSISKSIKKISNIYTVHDLPKGQENYISILYLLSTIDDIESYIYTKTGRWLIKEIISGELVIIDSKKYNSFYKNLTHKFIYSRILINNSDLKDFLADDFIIDMKQAEKRKLGFEIKAFIPKDKSIFVKYKEIDTWYSIDKKEIKKIKNPFISKDKINSHLTLYKKIY